MSVLITGSIIIILAPAFYPLIDHLFDDVPAIKRFFEE